MPISLSKATALQLGLCLTKSKTEWFVQQRETHGSFLLKVARLASQPHSDNDDEPQTGLGPLTVDDCRNLMDIFSAPAMNLNEALYTDLTKMAKMSMAEARKILRSHQVREFTSWVDFSERMPDKLVEELNLDVFFALPNGIKVHQNSGLRKNFGTGLDRVKEEVWKYRGNFDFSSQLSRANINAVFGFTELELEHVIDVQLGELAWQRGPCRIFGEVVCDKEFMGKSIDLFNSVCNLNVTTKDINRRKGQVVKNWKDKDDGPVKNPRLFDRLPYSPSLWRNSEAEMKKSFDHMFDLTFSTVGKAAGFDRSEMLQRWKDPKMKLRKRAQIAFLEELHKVLQEMLGCEFWNEETDPATPMPEARSVRMHSCASACAYTLLHTHTHIIAHTHMHTPTCTHLSSVNM